MRALAHHCIVLCWLGLALAYPTSAEPRAALVGSSLATAEITDPMAFAKAFERLDFLLDRGTVIPRFFALLERSDPDAFERLQRQFASAEKPLNELVQLGADSQAASSLLSMIRGYASYQVGGGGLLPLNAELDQRLLLDSLAKLQGQLNKRAASDHRRWQQAERQRGLMALGLVLCGLLVLLSSGLLWRRRQAYGVLQKRLDAEQQRRNELVASLPGAVLVCAADGTILSASDGVSTLLGYRNLALCQRGLKSLFPARFEHLASRLVEAPPAKLYGKGLQLMLLSHSGREVAVELQASTFQDTQGWQRRLLLIRDMGEQELLYERYQYCLQRFDLAMAASQEALWDWDLASGKVYLSPAWLALVGVSGGADRDGLDVLRCAFPEEEQLRLRPLLVEFLKSSHRTFSVEHRLRRADGSLIEVSAQAAVQRSPSGKVVRLVALHRDIGGAKREEDRLRATLRSLEDRLRLAAMKLGDAEQRVAKAERAKTAFLSVVGHELRTPMNGVVGMSDLLAKSGLNSEQRAMLDTIDRSSQSLLATLDNMIDYSLLEAGDVVLQAEFIELRDYLEGLAMELVPLVSAKQQRFIVHLDPQIPQRLWVDPARLRQLLLALLENAVKFSTFSLPRGCVEFRVRPANSPQCVAGGATELIFEVGDNGVGIAQENAQELFRPFVQAESSRSRRFGGVGLGLAVADKLATLMGGEIHLLSESGRGSTFAVRLPFERFVAPLVRSPDPGTRVIAQIADKQLRPALEAALSYRGWSVEFVGDQGAMERAVTGEPGQRGPESIVISDCWTPWLEGLQGRRIYLQGRAEPAPRPLEPGFVLCNPLLPSQLYSALESCLAKG